MNNSRFAILQRLKGPGLAAVAVLILAVGIGANTPSRGAELSRDSDWTTASPEEVGMDSRALAEMLDAIREDEIPVHSVQIVRHGRMALDAYFYPFRAGQRHDVASVTKSITSTLIGLAIDHGHLKDVKQPVLSFFPNIEVAALDARKRLLTVEHLLTMQGGWDCGFEPKEGRLFEMRRSADWIKFMFDLPMAAEPGTRFAYCSGNCHVLSAILNDVTGTNALAFARSKLFEPLGIQDFAWPADSQGRNHGWGDLQLLPRDMAKIGQLFLQRGRWKGRQIISETWIQVATRAHVERTSNKDRYGYFWWVKGEDYPGMFEALGRGGQRINIWPTQDLVLVFTGGEFEPGDLAKFILKALKSSEPLPANPEALASLRQRIAVAATGPTSKPMKRLPAAAKVVSGKTFDLSTNGAGLDQISLKFDGSPEAQVELGWNGRRLSFPVGLDSVERFSMNPLVNLLQAAKGEWTGERTFLLQINLVGGINDYRLKLIFSADGDSLEAELNERTGLNKEQFSGNELAVRHVDIAPRTVESRVPEVTAQGRFLAAQGISAVDVSADGKIITAGTMAFSHDANVWQFGPDGEVIAKRHFPPWAPMQVATLSGGRAMAVGLAYSRVTSPDPTVWFGSTEELVATALKDESAEADPSEGQLARLRPGAGDWRTGWLASHLGELFVRGPDWVFKPPRWLIDTNGRRQELRFERKNLLATSRAMRMAASADGKRIAFGWLGLAQNVPGVPTHADAVSVWQVNPNQKLWTAPPTVGPPPALPDPVADFPEMAKDFRLAADAIVPGHAATAVTLNRDGSRVAIVEYGVWCWVRNKPAIGKWNPPIRALNFLPKQRGRLRVFDSNGKELFRESLPEEGMFEVAFNGDTDDVWCWPTAWFARGMAGAAWLPVDRPARTLYRIELNSGRTTALAFPDAIADCATSSESDRSIVSCWDGRIYLLDYGGKLVATLDAGGPARLAWSGDGSFAIAGTADGRLFRVEKSGELSWNRTIPVTEPPQITRPPTEVVAGLPIFQGGRIPGEHAYVGDIWIIKSGNSGVIIDAGGTSATAMTRARLRALGIEKVTHVLHTHTHGDHAGGAYLWRVLGAQMVAPRPAAFTLTWLMPMLTDYGIYPPRPLDIPLPLERAGDETDFELSGLKFHALFVPGHSFDLTMYTIELGGKRIAFTGDLGFENQDILHRCWGDAEKAGRVVQIIRTKLLPWRPDIVFTGHGVRPNGTEFLEKLVRQTEEALGLTAPTETKEN